VPLRPLHCALCGSTRLSYLKVGVDDEVAICGMCHGVTEFSDDLTDEEANADLVLHLEKLRIKHPMLEEGGQYEAARKRKGPSVVLLMIAVISGLGALGLLLGREALLRQPSDRLDQDRMLHEDALSRPEKPPSEVEPAEEVVEPAELPVEE